jgi:hypothetical protein
MTKNPTTANPLHQPETEFRGEIQVFSGPALAPDDPKLEPRVRKGRLAAGPTPPHSPKNESSTQN